MAEWLQENKNKPQINVPHTENQKMAVTKKQEKTVASSGSKTQFQIMQQMANMLQHLKEEVETIKEERPREKVPEGHNPEEDSSMGSFSTMWRTMPMMVSPV